jgi:hypothetical protein
MSWEWAASSAISISMPKPAPSLKNTAKLGMAVRADTGQPAPLPEQPVGQW